MSKSRRYRLSSYGINLLRVKAVIGGTQKGLFGEVTLLVDTGSSFTILPVKVVEGLGYDLNNPIGRMSVTTGRSNTPPLPIIKLSWFNCVGQYLEDFEVIVYNIPPTLRVSGLLGMDFLSRCGAVLSIATSEIYFP